MNVVAIIGRLTADPETRYTQDGTAVARYTLAIDGGKDSTDFVPVVAFGKAAEHAGKYFSKGLRVGVTGRLQTGSYTNKEGKKVYAWNVVAAMQYFADGKAQKEGADIANQFAGVNEDEIPFM